MSANYKNLPRVTIVYSTDLSYIRISYYGNTSATSAVVSSGNQTSGTYTTGDLSFNTLYNFTLTPYDISGNPDISDNITVNTTPSVNGVFATNSTASNTQIQWYGTYSYVKVYRKITAPYTTSYIDVSAGTNFTTVPYYDKDLSGNTTYSYIIRPYDSANTPYNDSTELTVTTNAQAARDLSAVFIDNSGIVINFTLPKNSYSSSYYYQLSAVYGGNVLTVNGNNSPLLITGLSGSTSYNCYILSYLDNILRATSNVLNVNTINKFISISYTGSVSIVSYTNTVTYKNYVFTSGSANTFQISQESNKSTTFYILAVGGGGAGNLSASENGGGGGGGVFQYALTVTGPDTITINVGNGGIRSDGSNTTLTFLNNSYNSSKVITACGGGCGGSANSSISGRNGLSISTGYGSGGSGGGTGRDLGTTKYGSGGTGSGVGVNGNAGGTTNTGWSGGGGGGGAGSVGVNGFGDGGSSNQKAGAGGAGISCTLVGIDNSYKWGGGGGGSINPAGSTSNPGNGGVGGGGAGNCSTTGGATNGSGLYTTVTAGGNGSSSASGNGGTNTGGGGGGTYNTTGGNGGSGIVIIGVLSSIVA